MTLLFQSSP